jgi:CBS domain-containing protein
VALPAGAPLLDAVTAMLTAGALAVDVGDAGRVSVDDVPLADGAGLRDLLTALAGADRVGQLTAVMPAVRRLLRALVGGGADVADAGRVQAAVGDALVRRLLVIARRELGDAPADFAWLVFGSHARREQTPASDQDHGLVYERGLDADGHQWFARLGEWMTAALETCGLRRCPGGVMASRPEWRHDLDGWARAVRDWTDPTDAAGLVGADIGFDVRAVAGTGSLAAGDVADRLSRLVADATRGELTAARLAAAAVSRRPPNPLWGRVGRNPLGPAATRLGRFDLKRDGVQPIVDLARVHTLVRGGRQVDTPARLAAAAANGQMGPDLAATLAEGLRLLTWTRLSAQLGDPDEGDDVDWRRLPPPVRRQFSETFGAVRAAQDALRARYRLAPGR